MPLYVSTYTDAPPEYDGFQTRTTAIVGTLDGRTVRLVTTPSAFVDWQLTRYGSGLYMAATAEEYHRLFAERVKRPETASH